MEETITDLQDRRLVRDMNRFRNTMIIVVLLLLSHTVLHAQCSGTIYDSGGSGGNYSNNENTTNTYSAPQGSVMKLTINSFNLASGDNLYIYDGTSTASPLMYTLSGSNYPEVITSTGTDITLHFDSNGSGTASGWAIELDCYQYDLCAGTPSQGLIAYYDFKETSGNVVHDISGYGTPLNMIIENTGNVSWDNDCGLTINTATEITSTEPATKIIDALKASNAFTIEAWVQPSNDTQDGPSRIVSISENTSNRNVTLGQENDEYVSRLRTSDGSNSNNGTPEVLTSGGFDMSIPQHLVYTWDAGTGNHRIYVDGVVRYSGTRPGNLSNWNDNYHMVFANEINGGRDWLGTLYTIAIYDRILSESEISDKYLYGECCPVNDNTAEYDCASGVEIAMVYSGLNYDIPKTLDFGNLDNIDSVHVEIVYKGGHPGNNISIQDDAGNSYTSPRTSVGSGAFLYSFDLPATSSVTYTNTNNQDDAQSMLAYVFRSGQPGKAYNSVYTTIGGYNDTRTFQIPIPPRSQTQDINVSLPVSEITYDNRGLNFTLTAGGVSQSYSQSWGPGDVPATGCCFEIIDMTIEDVPTSATFVEVEIESPSSGGQSYVIAGIIYVEVECFEPEICIDGIDNDNDGLIDCEDRDCGFVVNREFDNELDDWILYVNSNGGLNSATMSIDNSWELSGENSAYIRVIDVQSSPVDWYVQFMQTGHSIEESKVYEISFEAKSTANRSMNAVLQLNNSPWTTYFFEQVDLTTSATFYSYQFTASETQLNNLKLYFALGESDRDVWIDNVQFKEVCADCTAEILTSDQTQCQNAAFAVEANPAAFGSIGTWSVISGSATPAENWNDPTNVFTIPPGTTVLRWTVEASGECSEYDEITLTNTTTCSVECIDPLNENPDLEDNGAITNFDLNFLGSDAALIQGQNNPAGWAERYGTNNPNTSIFNGAYYIDTSPSGSTDALSGDHMIYLKGNNFCLSPLNTTSGLACGKTYKFSVWVAAFTYSGSQEDAPFALEFAAFSNWGGPSDFFSGIRLTAPASTSWSNLNWNRYEFEVTLPADGYDWADFFFTTFSDDHGIVVDDVCITEVSSGSEAIAGADIAGCSNVFNLQANTPPAGYSGFWMIEEGDITLSSNFSPTVTATLNNGTFGELVWTVTDGVCSSSDRILLSYNPPPDLVINDVDMCFGESAVISVSGCAGDIVWETGETTESITVSPTSSRPYTVTCTDAQSANILLNPGFESSTDLEHWSNWGNASITSDAQHVQEGNKAVFVNASSAWGGLGQSVNVIPGEHYTLSFFAKTNNSNAVPYFGMVFQDNSWNDIGQGDDVEIRSGGYQQYTITGIAPENSAYLQIGGGVSSPAQLFIDNVSLTRGSDCARTTQVNVNVLDLPTVSAVNDGPLDCAKTSVTLTAFPAGASYVWSGGGTARTKNVTTVGTYTVTVTDANGCTAVASTTVNEDLTAPNASAAVDDIITCANTNTTVIASPAGLSYVWSGGGTSRTKTVSAGGYHTVTVTGTNGCTAEASVYVMEDNTPPTVELEDATACFGETVTIEPSGLCESYPEIISDRPLEVAGWNTNYGELRSPLIGDGELCFTLDSSYSASAQMIGLNSDPDTDNSYLSLDYSIYIYIRPDQNRTALQVREDGFARSVIYESSETLEGYTICLTRTGSTIEYLVNGVVAYTSTKASTENLYYDHSFYSGGGVWSDGYSSFTDISLCGDIQLDYLWSTGETSKTIDVSSAGMYTITVTDAKGCTAEATSDVFIAPEIIPAVSNSGLGTCDNPDVIITAEPSGMSYLWEDGSNGQTLTVNTEGTYFVTITDSNFCTAVGFNVVDMAEDPEVQITGESVLCLGETTTLSPTSGGIWESSDESIAIVSNDGNVASLAAGSVTFTFTETSTGCSSIPTATITVVPEISVDINYSDALCVEDGSTLTAIPTGGLAPFVYTWVGPNGLNESTESISISDHGYYFLTVTDNAGCSAQTSGYVNERFDPFIFTLNSRVCEGEEVNLTVNSGNAVAYQWDAGAGNATTASVNVIPTPPSSTYYVTVTNDIGCTSIAVAEILVDEKVLVSVEGNTEICVGEKTQLQPSSGGNWISSDPAIATVSNSGLVTASNSGSVTFIFTDSATNCASDPTTPITISDRPVGSIIGPTVICPGETTTLSPTSGGYWQSSNESIATVTQDGIVTAVSGGSANFYFTNALTGCVSDVTSSITVNPRPVVNITGPDNICVGVQTFLTPTSGGTWSSSNPERATISNSGVVTALSGGTVYFTFTSAFGCVSEASSPIIVSDNVAVDINGASILCEGESQILTASSPGGVWSSNNSSIASVDPATGEVTGLSAGTVLISYSNSGNGCYMDADKALEVKDTPTAFISGSVSICAGEVTTLSASTSGSWSSSDSDVAIVSNNGIAVGIGGGTATFTFTADNSCSSAETGILTVHPDLDVTIDFGEMVCLSDDMQLTANPTGGTPIYNYSWTGPGGFASNQQVIDVSIDGNYQLEVTDGAGCSTSTAAYVYAAYEPFIFALDTEICEGEDVTMSVNSTTAAQFQWSANTGNLTTQSITVTPSPPSTIYQVTITNNQGCSSVATTEIFVNETPETHITGSTTICEGETTTLTPSTGGLWTSSNTNVATITNAGEVTGILAGTATFTYRNTTTNCISAESAVVTVAENSPVDILGDNQLCIGVPTVLTSSVAGGSWSSSDESIVTVDASGELTPITQGNAIITYTSGTNECFINGDLEVTVNELPSVNINGPNIICQGENTFLIPTNGGIWTSSDESIATVSNIGVVTGIAGGDVSFTFTSFSGCSQTLANQVTVLANPDVQFTGPSDICVDEQTTLSPTTGGIWMSSQPSIASVNSSGVVTAINAGTTTFTFVEFINGCVSGESLTLTVNDPPAIGVPNSANLCIGETTNISPSSGGSWSSTNPAVATIANDGTITAVSAGAAAFIYTHTLTGCSSQATTPVVVDGKPTISLSGPDEICVGETSDLTPTTGGQWFSTDVSIATITNQGQVTAVSPGDVQFLFLSNTTGCISDSSAVLEVKAPVDVEITGADRICIGTTTTLSPSTGGTWSSSNENIATVTNSGVITAHNPGNVSFTFNSNATCTSNPTSDLIVDPKPNALISGNKDICVGASTTLSPSSGGTWTSSNPNIATVDNAGVVTAVASGSVYFSYVDNITGCTANTASLLNVYPAPETSVSGNTELCIGETTNLLPSSDGSWMSNNPSVATITPSGMVSALSAGTATFTFTEGVTGCVSQASEPITVLPRPTVSIDGSNTICVGENTTLLPATGGSWVSSNINVATVTDNGVVTGVGQGLVKFTFVSDEGCTSNETSPVIVYARPSIFITGVDELCVGENTQLSPSSGGSWTSSDDAIATISNSGEVTAISSGNVRFTFVDSSTGCASKESEVVTVIVQPEINVIGSTEICVGGTTNLVPTAGGVWSSSNSSVATIANNGEVTGVSAGTATFQFTELASGCTSQVSADITVNAGPPIGTLGSTTLCIGETTTISPNSGGTWQSTKPNVATITNDGVIEAVAQGAVRFRFTEQGTGCISMLSAVLTVNGPPTTQLTGNENICIGSMTTLSPVSGGVWTSTDETIATVTNNGVVTGISEGTTNFIFTNSTTGCSSNGNVSVTVGSEIPVDITGPDDICIGYTTTLSPTSGGVWVSSDPDIATVTNAGVVKARAPGKVSFEFIDISSGCTSGGITDVVTVRSCLSPDFKVSLVNQTVNGNLRTNDNIDAGAIYRNNVTLISKPLASIPSLTINEDGTYEFTSSKAGKYIYEVQVCLSALASVCPKSILEINVVENIYAISNPVSNLEFASTFTAADDTTSGQPITIDVLENDACVYTGGCGLDAATVTVIDAPSNGSTSINPISGEITYTPNADFYGLDTLVYEVCVQNENKCSYSTQIITVNHTSADNSTVGVDDFGFTLLGDTLTGNVLINDSDPENDSQTVQSVGTPSAPVSIVGGSYYIDELGNYEFIPNEDFTGAIEIVYTVCDDHVESVCTDATLHIQIFDYMSLNIRVYLEGAMMQNGGATSNITGRPLMRADLRYSPQTGKNLVPTDDPYSVLSDPFMNTPSKFNKLGPGKMIKNTKIQDSTAVMTKDGDDAIVDWVHVELRSKDDMTVPIATRSGLLQRDGDVVEVDGVSSLRFQGINIDSFYVVVKHRIHLGVMSLKVSSNQLIDFTSPDFPTFDFGTTLGNGIDYTGLAQKSNVVDGYNVLWAGDFDSNGKIKFTNPEDDQNIMFINVLFNSPNFLINYDNAYGYLTGDYNMDGKVKYTNPSDDLNYLFSQILLYPKNQSFLSNFNSMIEQVP